MAPGPNTKSARSAILATSEETQMTYPGINLEPVTQDDLSFLLELGGVTNVMLCPRGARERPRKLQAAGEG